MPSNPALYVSTSAVSPLVFRYFFGFTIVAVSEHFPSTYSTADGECMSYFTLASSHFRISFAAKLIGAKAGNALHASRRELNPPSDVQLCCGKGLKMCVKAG